MPVWNQIQNKYKSVYIKDPTKIVVLDVVDRMVPSFEDMVFIAVQSGHIEMYEGLKLREIYSSSDPECKMLALNILNKKTKKKDVDS